MSTLRKPEQAGTASGAVKCPEKHCFFFLDKPVFKLAASFLAFHIPISCEAERSGLIESSHTKGSRLFAEADIFL